MNETTAKPEEIRLNKDKDTLTVRFDNGRSFVFSAEFLRVESPSAEVQGHSPAEKKTVPGKRDVKITDIEAVGHYAIRITFDDGHNTGLYSWIYFSELGESHDKRWARYLEALQMKGLSRER